MTAAPAVTVVIATLNREEPLVDTVRYFLQGETAEDFELIVVDQTRRHEPETERYLSSEKDRFRWIRVDYANLPRARNDGARAARGWVVLYVDDDVAPEEGFVAAHLRAYADPRTRGVTGPVKAPGKPLLGRADVGEKEVRALEAALKMRFDVDFAYPARWAGGCNMSFRRGTILAAGGFDETFRGGVLAGEDEEFGFRVRRTVGGEIRYVPEAALVHLKAKTGGCRSENKGPTFMVKHAFNVGYRLARLRLPAAERLAHVWSEFRGRVLHRRALTDLSAPANVFAFFWGLCGGIREAGRNEGRRWL